MFRATPRIAGTVTSGPVAAGAAFHATGPASVCGHGSPAGPAGVTIAG